MLVRKSKLTMLLFKTITETARSCGRNLSERQKKEIFLKVQKDVGDITRGKKVAPKVR